MRTIRKGNLKLNYISGCEPELFDLEADPGEWNNVADDPAYRSRRDEMEKIILKDWDIDRCDELRWQSEERRKAIMESMKGASFGWQVPSQSPEHPLGYE